MKYIALILMFPMIALAGGHKSYEKPKPPIVPPVVVSPPVITTETTAVPSSRPGGRRHPNGRELQIRQLELMQQLLALLRLKLYTLPSNLGGKG